MNGADLCRRLCDIAPAGICVAAGGALTTPLTTRERASLGAAVPDRVREFESGRAYAKRALGMLGISDVELPVGPTHAPVWPAGVTGSISHVRRRDGGLFAAAAVANGKVASAVGIDLETEDSLHPHVWPYVLTQSELERVLALPTTTRRKEMQHIWCAKEAAAKVVREPFDPCKVEIERDPKSGDFIAKFTGKNGRGFRGGISGRTACLEPMVIAIAAVPASLFVGAGG